jgi:urease accessory protein
MTYRLLLSTPLLLAATPAFAHVGQHLGFSAANGFAHPLMGLDHLAAMVAVGLWAAMAGARRIWIWPAAFVVAMLVGGFIGHAGIELPQVEPVIALSVVVLGVLVAAGVSASVPVGVVLIAAFAIFHGHAHGAEAPAEGWAGYALGFAVATALLHLVGIGVGLGLQRMVGTLPVRALGAVTAVFGIVTLTQ